MDFSQSQRLCDLLIQPKTETTWKELQRLIGARLSSPNATQRHIILYTLEAVITPETSTILAQMEYNNYLKSLYWAIIRSIVQAKSFHLCEVCKSPRTLQVHHLTYKRRGFEHKYLSDLVVLCRSCHKLIHKESKFDRAAVNKLRKEILLSSF